jgi:uncharacterized alpha-E superfamily protein
MTQDAGWRLLRIGRRLERLQFGAHFLALYVESAPATRQRHVEWLLNAHDSMRVYRSRYALTPRLGPALDLLVRDAEHPSALTFLSHALTRDLAALSTTLGRTSIAGGEDDEVPVPLPVLSDDDLLTLESEDPPGEQARQRLATRLRALGGAAGTLSDRISMRHFAHISLDSQALAI